MFFSFSLSFFLFLFLFLLVKPLSLIDLKYKSLQVTANKPFPQLVCSTKKGKDMTGIWEMGRLYHSCGCRDEDWVMGLGLRPQPVPSLLLQRKHRMFLVRKQQWCIDMSAACLEQAARKR